jgi:hypothetical protein
MLTESSKSKKPVNRKRKNKAQDVGVTFKNFKTRKGEHFYHDVQEEDLDLGLISPTSTATVIQRTDSEFDLRMGHPLSPVKSSSSSLFLVKPKYSKVFLELGVDDLVREVVTVVRKSSALRGAFKLLCDLCDVRKTKLVLTILIVPFVLFNF